jgi:hypothetical protein
LRHVRPAPTPRTRCDTPPERAIFLEKIVNRVKAAIALSVLATAGIAGQAHAWGRVGVWVGGPVYYPYPYAPPPVPYYYYPPPPVMVAPSAPTTYVEQGQPAADGAPAQQPGTWYYCESAKAYYPYVKQCASGWREVPASPPPSN